MAGVKNRFGRSRLRVGIAAGGTVLLVIQLVGVERTNPPVRVGFTAPPDVEAVLEQSCSDCHSNETRWPWYSGVAPASWLVARDVVRAREELNLSEWPVDPTTQAFLLSRIAQQVEEGRMPMDRYTLLHPAAGLSDEERKLVVAWAREESQFWSDMAHGPASP